MRRIPFLATLFLLSLFTSANAADRYVSPSGSGASCTIGSPCTIATAMAAAVAGDNVYCADGTYNLTAAVQSQAAGTVGARIYLGYYQTARGPVFDFGDSLVNGIDIRHGYWTVEGITVQNVGYSGIKVDGDDNGTASAASYGNYGGNGVRNYHPNGANGVTIRNNKVEHIGLDGLKIGHADSITIENNEITNTGVSGQQQGIDLVGCYDFIIRYNNIYDGEDGQMNIGLFVKGGSQNGEIYGNIISDIVPPNAAMEIGGSTEWWNTRYTLAEVTNASLNTDILSQEDASNEIDEVGDFAGSGSYEAEHMAEARNILVYANVIVNSDPGISLRGDYNSVIVQNTLIDCGQTQKPFKVWNDGNSTHPSNGAKLYNNLIYNDTVDIGVLPRCYQFKDTSSITTSDYNFAYSDGQTLAWDSGSGQDSHSILNTDPQINVSYQPSSGSSPLVNAGYNLLDNSVIAETITDYDGTEYPSGEGYDIGANEYEVTSDTTDPTITAFDLDATSSSLSVPLSFTCTDETALHGTSYCSTETDDSGTCSWQASISAYTFGSAGEHTLYGFCRDLAGNISDSSSDTTTITLPTVTSVMTIGSGSTNFIKGSGDTTIQFQQ